MIAAFRLDEVEGVVFASDSPSLDLMPTNQPMKLDIVTLDGVCWGGSPDFQMRGVRCTSLLLTFSKVTGNALCSTNHGIAIPG